MHFTFEKYQDERPLEDALIGLCTVSQCSSSYTENMIHGASNDSGLPINVLSTIRRLLLLVLSCISA